MRECGAMLCQVCQQKEAMVHLTTIVAGDGQGLAAGTDTKQHFCERCADAYFAEAPGMNSARGLICLSDSYRSKLYDLLEELHPEAFDNKDDEACTLGSTLMRNILREHFKMDNLDMNEDAFEMLCHDFFCSHHFYTRVEGRKRKGS